MLSKEALSLFQSKKLPGEAGLSVQDARRAALLELGGVEQTKENVRGVKAGALVWQVWTDLLHGTRIIRRNRGFAAVVKILLNSPAVQQVLQ